MKTKQLLLTAVAALVLSTTGAMARDFDRDGRPDRSYAEHHDRDGYRDRDVRVRDRYWRPEYRGYMARDRFYVNLRMHHFNRWDGEPVWFHGHYVIRSYDRFGRPIFVELNPYTGEVIGVIRF